MNILNNGVAGLGWTQRPNNKRRDIRARVEGQGVAAAQNFTVPVMWQTTVLPLVGGTTVGASMVTAMQLRKVEDDVRTLYGNMTTVKESQATMQASLVALEESVGELKTTVTDNHRTLDSKIDKLDSKIDKLDSKIDNVTLVLQTFKKK